MPTKPQSQTIVKPRQQSAPAPAEKATSAKKVAVPQHVGPREPVEVAVDARVLRRKRAAVLKAKQTRKAKKVAANAMAEAKEDALGVVKAGLGIIPTTGTVTSVLDLYYSLKKLSKSAVSALKARRAAEARLKTTSKRPGVRKQIERAVRPKTAPFATEAPTPRFLRMLAGEPDDVRRPAARPSAKRAQAGLRKATARNARTRVRLTK
ncbi:MAG: hypothetical protein EXR67_07035 [Dehalococcoidia bacterium]|nr:hypothetical protein [Dehalococcoidia bacterium]